jgi:hypothetical protein
MPPSPPDPDDDAAPAAESGRDTAGIPRWVKLFGIVAVVLVLLVVIVMLIAGGNHGPGRHSGSGSTPSFDLAHTEGGAVPEGPSSARRA